MTAIIGNFASAMAVAAASFVLMWVVGIILKKTQGDRCIACEARNMRH